MKNIAEDHMNLAGRTFRAISNSANGSLNTDTEMRFESDDGIVAGEIQAGRAQARFTDVEGSPIRMNLDWQWLTGDQSSGQSEWVLVSTRPTTDQTSAATNSFTTS
jgi:Tfp pilus assembly protein FimT